MEIKGCCAVVTGGASGLGEATVRCLVNEGAKAVILDFDEDRGKQVAAELVDSVIFCKTDVTDENGVQEAMDKAVDTFGGVHFAINCAGVGTPAKMLSKRGPLSIEQFNRTVQINLTGTVIVTRIAAENRASNATSGPTTLAVDRGRHFHQANAHPQQIGGSSFGPHPRKREPPARPDLPRWSCVLQAFGERHCQPQSNHRPSK